MANLKAGQVAYIKTTEEPIFILEVGAGKTLPDFPQLEQVLVIVRRPVQSESGVYHKIETFYAQELESPEDKRTKQIAEMEEYKARFSPNEGVPAQGELFRSN